MMIGEVPGHALEHGRRHVGTVAPDIGNGGGDIDHLADQQIGAFCELLDTRARAGVSGIDDRTAGEVEAEGDTRAAGGRAAQGG